MVGLRCCWTGLQQDCQCNVWILSSKGTERLSPVKAGFKLLLVCKRELGSALGVCTVCGAQKSTSDFLRQDFFLSLEFMLCLAGWPGSFYNLHACAQHLWHWDNRVYHNTWLPPPTLKNFYHWFACQGMCGQCCGSQFSIIWVLGIKLRLSGWQQAPLPSKLSSWLFVVCDLNSGAHA